MISDDHHTPQPHQDISQLFLQLAEGDRTAFERLYYIYHDRIYQLTFAYTKSRELAQDSVQQVFLRIWERRAELRDITNPEGWLFKAAKYQAWNLLEKDYNNDSFRQKLIATLGQQAVAVSPEDKLHVKERKRLVEKALSLLPEKQMMVYRMGREEGLTYEEIGQRLGIGKETVKEHMAKALKKLKTWLQQYRDDIVLIIFIFSLFL